MCPHIALTATSACAVISRLHPTVGGSPTHPAESSSSTCGPTVHLRLLPTPPHGDAVTFGYGAVAYSDTDLHRADSTPSWAHIGVGKGKTLPALRTVHAVLPHTALQSVVSSSGSARRHVGFVHGEKSTFSEKGIRPSSVVCMGSTRARMLSLLIQYRPESTTY